MRSLNVLPCMLTSNHNESAFIFFFFFWFVLQFLCCSFSYNFFSYSLEKRSICIYTPIHRIDTTQSCANVSPPTHTHSWALCIVLHTESSTAFSKRDHEEPGVLKLWRLSCFIVHRDQGKTPGKKQEWWGKKERLTIGIMAAESSWEKYNTCWTIKHREHRPALFWVTYQEQSAPRKMEFFRESFVGASHPMAPLIVTTWFTSVEEWNGILGPKFVDFQKLVPQNFQSETCFY